METEPQTSAPSPWKRADFLLPLFLLMPAADFAAIHGDQAAALHILGADVVRACPWLMIAAAVFTPLMLAGSRLARWRHGITAALVILCVVSAPCLLGVVSSSIPLSRGLSKQEYADLQRAFEIPSVRYAASGEGHRLRVRRADDTVELRRHLQLIGVLRTEAVP